MFAVFSLCDNDYSASLLDAVTIIKREVDNSLSEEQLKHVVIKYMMFDHALYGAFGASLANKKEYPLDIEREKRVESYLNDSLTVFFTESAPDIDHDNGSVAWDMETGYIWTY